MPRWQRIYLASCAGIIGYALAYVMCSYGGWPRLTYYPLERQWRFVVMADRPEPMSFLGMVLWGAGGAAVGIALALVAARWARAPLAARWLNLAGAWALTAVGLGAAYYTWSLWPF